MTLVDRIQGLKVGDKIFFRSPTGKLSSLQHLEGKIERIYLDGRANRVFSVGKDRHLIEAAELLFVEAGGSPA